MGFQTCLEDGTWTVCGNCSGGAGTGGGGGTGGVAPMDAGGSRSRCNYPAN